MMLLTALSLVAALEAGDTNVSISSPNCQAIELQDVEKDAEKVYPGWIANPLLTAEMNGDATIHLSLTRKEDSGKEYIDITIKCKTVKGFQHGA